MMDPVADKSGFLCTYMGSHPDTLVAYAKHFGKVDGHLLSAKMLSIDSKGMNLEYNTKDSPKRPQIVHIEFDPPLLGYEEVKPRLLGMKADADEALGIDKAPQITHFEMPFQIWITSSLLLLLIYGTCMPSNSQGVFWWLARKLRPGVFSGCVVHCFVGICNCCTCWRGTVRDNPRTQTSYVMERRSCLGRLGNDFWIPSVDEDPPSRQGSADRVDHEG